MAEVRNGRRAESFSQNPESGPVGHAEIYKYQRCDVKMTSQNNLRYQPYVAVSGNLGGKVPVLEDVFSSHEQPFYPTTSQDEIRVEFEFQTDRNYYVDLSQPYLALKVKLVKGRGYDTHKSKEGKKEHKTKNSEQKQRPMMKRTVLTRYPFLPM